ncbi:MAG: glycine-rich protein, partial [Anaerolineales bacterium]|nr:glycine-rich protein [Anaerolineales bacterium]
CFGASSGPDNSGFSTGTLATSASTQYAVVVGECTAATPGAYGDYPYGGGGRSWQHVSGGGLSGVFTGTGAISFTSTTDQARAIIIAGGGGGRGPGGNAWGGAGGGLGAAGSGTFSYPATNIATTDSAYENQAYRVGSGGTQSAAGSYSGGAISGNVMQGGDSYTSAEEMGGGGGYFGGCGSKFGGPQVVGAGGGSGYVGTQNGLTAGATYYSNDAGETKLNDPDYPGNKIAKVLFKYDIAIFNNMTLISNAQTAQAAPTKADFVMTYTDGVGTTTVNTDLKAYASRDDGTTWTQLTLASQGTVATHTILTAHDLDISGQPSGTAMKYKITTHNQSATKETRVHAVSLGWS